MSRELEQPESSLGVEMTGSNEEGQRITLDKEDALKSIFNTKYPEIANALMQPCFKVLKSNEASDE